MIRPAEQAPAARKSRFSDRLEHRRGLHDAERGRAPASRAPAYAAGYAEGRRRRPRRSRAEVSEVVPRPKGAQGLTALGSRLFA